MPWILPTFLFGLKESNDASHALHLFALIRLHPFARCEADAAEREPSKDMDRRSGCKQAGIGASPQQNVGSVDAVKKRRAGQAPASGASRAAAT